MVGKDVEQPDLTVEDILGLGLKATLDPQRVRERTQKIHQADDRPSPLGRLETALRPELETTFNIQRRMADFHFARAGNWRELVEAHDRFIDWRL